MDLIHKRRSIRNYLNQPIPKQDILKCLEAARFSPSACNAQPWKFIVVDEPVLKDTLSEAAFCGIYAMNKFAKNASVLIAVVSEREKFISALGGKLRNTRYCLFSFAENPGLLVRGCPATLKLRSGIAA
ncbi:MAG: hypothetical protein A3K83_05900 [Omnitrophica WOR_2 bacterium RBG_13_44_8b]|nr:MAG: hypothetical protein A3K83_05900 [Omnitrophica WOR_2 bacterium RBG_13_44_8b]